MLMDDKQISFLPFHAINEFMLEDYRREVLQVVLTGMNRLPAQRKTTLSSQIKRHVQVPGFRNSAQAPAPLKLRGSIKAFQSQPDFTAQVLQAWSELNADLRQKVYALLVERGWEVLPPEAERTRLPGFLADWPAGENYDVLDAGFSAMYPETQASSNDVRLMAVWLGGRLPYGATTSDPEEAASEA